MRRRPIPAAAPAKTVHNRLEINQHARIMPNGRNKCGLILPVSPDARIFSEYFAMIQGLQNDFIPNLGAVLRILVHPGSAWIQGVPAVIGVAWGLWYFARHRKRWSWDAEGALLLLVSALVAPYSWLTDEMLVLPAIMGAIYTADRKSLIVFSAINAIPIAMIPLGIPSISGLYFWTASAWLAWYLYATARRRLMDGTAVRPQTVEAGPANRADDA